MSADWYVQDILYLVRHFETDLKTGLTTTEALSRVRESANSDLALRAERPAWRIVAEQAACPKTIVLTAIALLALVWNAVAGVASNGVALVLLGLTLIDLGFRVVQRLIIGRQLRSVEGGTLRAARVFRDGEIVDIEARDVVAGDILYLQAGDYIPADARIFEAERLRVNEMPLTGISDLSEKRDTVLEGALSHHEQCNMVFAGTLILAGSGKAIAVATGRHRAIAQVYARRHVEPPVTEILDQLLTTTPKLTLAAAVGGCLIAAGLAFFGADAMAELTVAIGLGVAFFAALTPSAAQLAASIVFAQNLRQLGRMGSVVQDVDSIEHLRQVTTLCFDPRGVMTEERMVAHHIFVDGQVYDAGGVTGLFPEPHDADVIEDVDLVLADDPGGPAPEPPPPPSTGVETPPDLYLLFTAASLCAENTSPGEDGWEAMEPLTKRALLGLADDIGVGVSRYEGVLLKAGECPYDSIRRRQSTLFRGQSEGGYLFVIGGGEAILNQCRLMQIHGEEDVLQARQRGRLLQVYEGMCKEATEVIAVAYRKLTPTDDDARNPHALEDNLVFLGMISFRDELTSGVREAAEQCSRAGMRLILMSDYEMANVFRLAREAGLLEQRSQMLSDDQLRRMEDEDILPLLDRISVYARLSGEQKARVIRLLQRKGSRVVFVGRQLYDIPALKNADIGIASRQWSVDAAAHEAGVLVEDVSLGSLYGILKFAKEAGERVRAVTQWALATHIGLATLLLLGLVLGRTDLFLPTPLELNHVLWLELLIFAAPLTFAAHALNLAPSRRWLTPGRGAAKGIRWGAVARSGIVLGLLGLAAGAYLYWSYGPVPEAVDIAGPVQQITGIAFVAASLAILLKSVLGDDTPLPTFLRLNPALLTGVVVSIAVAVVIAISPLAGLLGADATGVLTGARLTQWMVAPALAAVAWFLPVSD
ncbi:cation-transporting P-type ATPase [Candidatus Poribacteria bacterium]|jgi:P-type Ca2+ transporter type 2C|nr:cation-transporting P-type ATPase [Candidatus Poribacteria bacterium]MBT5534815.1 cation-transporting P-type ATPase [Candidatus Poribacteria bacterium]MBT5710050.1 cation-transporting P-type ATPase [Candidatus Poribacteria bacterium]MBT7808767.1 cation-transporting P-type ATPase [Candidatus Poribacteria bacterium]